MAKMITVRISDSDFLDMLKHMSKGNPGRALVAVDKLVAVDGDPDFDMAEELADMGAADDPSARRRS